MHRRIRQINTRDLAADDETRLSWHNELQQGEVLLALERMAALLGEQKIALESQFEMSKELRELPTSTAPPEERSQTQETLRAMIAAVDGPKRAEPEFSPEDVNQHNDTMREKLLDAWEELAHATGHHLLAIKMGREQPVVPFQDIRNSWEALGVAAFHAGSAELDYGLIRTNRDNPDPWQRHRSGEEDARIAHNVLHWIHEELAHGEKNDHAPEIRKYARQMNIMLTRERALATAHLGVEPAPWESDNLGHHDIDHDQKTLGKR